MPNPCTLPFFFFNDTATTEIYTLSLHDALPISWRKSATRTDVRVSCSSPPPTAVGTGTTDSDRKSTRLNSSHVRISYAVFCLKKKRYRGDGRQAALVAGRPERVGLTRAAAQERS